MPDSGDEADVFVLVDITHILSKRISLKDEKNKKQITS